jgi:hypothetical protein
MDPSKLSSALALGPTRLRSPRRESRRRFTIRSTSDSSNYTSRHSFLCRYSLFPSHPSLSTTSSSTLSRRYSSPQSVVRSFPFTSSEKATATLTTPGNHTMVSLTHASSSRSSTKPTSALQESRSGKSCLTKLQLEDKLAELGGNVTTFCVT